eukprot:Gregarina_sp_Poly_1__142@NODE_1031_length_5291_cov_107_018185_g716_i0_p1_GENE_NODE_1031_length_5291_cov_107_018185_g716_i0NODE_1031_length_5291_cov_107_018185_g716_i0_p1_ORF_typecomplete_len394_score50_72S1P1_nuclease/PF02265_16/1_8e30Gemini_mov/PF01708_16/0_28_NODE_1031_length_5291_cov_107_018185_g716_i0541235
MLRRLCLVLVPLVGRTWDTDGHAAVGMTVMSGVRGPALTQLKRLLGGKDVVDVAPWSRSVVKKYPQLEHIFENQQDLDPIQEVANCSAFDPTYLCPNKQCLVAATQAFYSKLTGTNSELTSGFKLPVNLKLTDADNIKFLVALIGELHNPARFGYAFNDGGRSVSVTYVDNGRAKETTLFQYWDSDLIQKTIRDRPNFWFSGWTHLNSLGRGFYEEQQRLWKEADAAGRLQLFESWAAESWKASCSRVQRRFAHGKIPDDTQNEQELLVPDKHSYTPSMIFLDFEFVKTKLLTAGIRASIILNSILEGRDAKKLRVGSGVQVQLEQNHALNPNGPSKTRASSLTQWSTNFAINLLIILTVLTTFGCFIKYSGSGAGSAMKSPTGFKGKEKDRD